MQLLSCSNCCHNPLQADAIGTSFGYCTEHRVVLRGSNQLTCGRHLRRDLTIDRAEDVRDLHEEKYHKAEVQFLRPNGSTPKASGFTHADGKTVVTDEVTEVVVDYGRDGSKIGALAELKRIKGVRAELARLSLSRAYTNRCYTRDRSWTSGLHQMWWTRRHLETRPIIGVSDLTVELPLSLDRQVEIATWFVVMLRLIYISDVATYAHRNQDSVGRLRNFAEEAAEGVGAVSPAALLRWVKQRGLKRFDSVLPERRYRALARAAKEHASGSGASE